jgi:glycosyltransferase involved in cell wall biosynthesis
MHEEEHVWVIVPAFNEGKVICSVLSALIAEGYNVVVVDDGSTDNTLKKVTPLAVHVCRHIVNLGQGAALQTGIRYALAKGATHLVTFDADGQHSHEDISRLLEPLMAGSAEVALGTRFDGGAIDMPAPRRLLLRIATLYTRLTWGMDVTDIHNGLRAFTAHAAAMLSITQNRMAHASQILRQILQNKMRFVEVPVTVRYTRYSLTKGQKISDSVNILWDSLAELFRR